MHELQYVEECIFSEKWMVNDGTNADIIKSSFMDQSYRSNHKHNLTSLCEVYIFHIATFALTPGADERTDGLISGFSTKSYVTYD